MKKKIKELHKIERPREKLQRYGAVKLSDAELLAIILGNGIKGTNVIELSKKILRKFPKGEIVSADLKNLNEISGLGPVKACQISACFELGRRFLQNKKFALVLSPKDVWEQLVDIRGKMKEHFAVFFLDARSRVVKREIVSVGILNASLIHPREVFEPAVRNLAAQIIVAHNHPSGEIEPSEEDILITKKLRSAGEILGIELLDHVIVSKNGYLSLKERGEF